MFLILLNKHAYTLSNKPKFSPWTQLIRQISASTSFDRHDESLTWAYWSFTGNIKMCGKSLSDKFSVLLTFSPTIIYTTQLKGEDLVAFELAPAARWSQDAGSHNLVFTFWLIAVVHCTFAYSCMLCVNPGREWGGEVVGAWTRGGCRWCARAHPCVWSAHMCKIWVRPLFMAVMLHDVTSRCISSTIIQEIISLFCHL